MKKVVVFGGGGYLGNVLVPMLANKGYKVFVIDTFWYGGIYHNSNNVQYFKEDILGLEKKDGKYLNNLFNDSYILILAGLSLEITNGIDPEFTKDININSPKLIVKLANKFNSKRIIFASSASVYGNKSLINVKEKDTPNPSNLYSKCKLEVEKYIFNKKYNNIATCATRSCTIVGYSPLFRIDLVVNRFATDAYYKNEINVYGGEQMRSCIHLIDISRVYCLLIEADDTIINGESFNIVSSKFTILELSQIVRRRFNNKVNVYPEIKDDRSYEINADKIKSMLKFEPYLNINDILVDLQINLIKGNIKQENFSYLEKTKSVFENYIS